MRIHDMADMPRLSKLEREIKRPGDWLLDRKERLERVQTEMVRRIKA